MPSRSSALTEWDRAAAADRHPPRARAADPARPDDWTVWAFSDAHGVLSGLEAGLREAGLVDSSLHWSAAPRTALVGCGDYVDRGRESRKLVGGLPRLQDEAPAGGGAGRAPRRDHQAQPGQAPPGGAA